VILSLAVSAAIGEQWLAVLLILVFLFGLFLGARLPLGRSSRGAKKDPRQSPDYIRGMYAMLTGDVDTAVERLSRVVEISTEPIEVYLALGNLFRQRGQIERAIRVHQSLLTRRSLSEEERVLALNALGADFRTGGFIDRSQKTFREALALNPKDPDALSQLVKISEDLGEWVEAYDYAVRLQKVQRHKDPRQLSFLLGQKAQHMADAGMHVRAAWSLKRAIRMHAENMLAYLSLTRLYLKVDRPDRALKTLQRAFRDMPHKSFMALPLLKEVFLKKQDTEGYLRTLHSLAHEHHQKRAMVQELQEFLDLHREEQAKEVVKTLVRHFGRSRLVQRLLWDLHRKGVLDAPLEAELAKSLATSEQMMDPFTCIYCGYKTLEVLSRCPNCKEWNPFSDGEG
jgi:lipopolysaccharide biosynthesis regulator YciM